MVKNAISTHINQGFQRRKSGNLGYPLGWRLFRGSNALQKLSAVFVYVGFGYH